MTIFPLESTLQHFADHKNKAQMSFKDLCQGT